MKVSLNSIRALSLQYGTSEDVAAIGVDALIEKIGAQLGGVEEVINLGKKYHGIIISKVVDCQPHPNADRLNVCTIDDGGIASDVKRDEKGFVQVVCGAPNVKAGLTVAWLPPGSTVPESVDKEPFVLEARELRGIVSNGMLASPKELALGDSHDGILEIDGDLKPGSDFGEIFGLKDDVILDIENKMFTHRPDCFGFLGLAREMAGIQGLPFKSPDWYTTDPAFPPVAGDSLPLTVQNELPGLVPRFVAITMRGVKVGPSPVWLQVELAKVGSRSINNIVDYTNFFMLLTGQPLHAYDYDKVKALSEGDPTIVIRNPHTNEKILLLNGKEVEPRAEAIMIATDKQAIGIGGVMGGGETEVDETTTNIILEAANFDMYSIRRTSMAHGLFTDAVSRFNKGQSPLQNKAVLAIIVDEISNFANGQVASELIDDNHLGSSTLDRASLRPPVLVSETFINQRLGFELSAVEMQTLLQNVEFSVALDEDNLTVISPFWRTDIELREDVVEEIGRLYGFDKLPLNLPERDLTPIAKDILFELKAGVRSELAAAGANEVLTYSFVHSDLLKKVGQDKDLAFQIGNALSPDLQYYRVSLTPSLLEKIHPNVKAGYDEFALFELGKSHIYGESDIVEPGVPKEVNMLSFVYTAKKSSDSAPYYAARHQLVNLLAEFHVLNMISFELLAGADIYESKWIEQMIAPFEPTRSALLRDAQGLIWGVVGEYKTSVRRALKLPDATAGFEIDSFLLLQAQQTSGYAPLPRFPKVSQDMTLQVPADVTYQQVFDFVWNELGKIQPENTLPMLSPVDIYQKEGDTEHKHVTLRLTLASYERTLTDQEVNTLLDTIAQAAHNELNAQRM